jgi:hypothetical protein
MLGYRKIPFLALMEKTGFFPKEVEPLLPELGRRLAEANASPTLLERLQRIRATSAVNVLQTTDAVWLAKVFWETGEQQLARRIYERVLAFRVIDTACQVRNAFERQLFGYDNVVMECGIFVQQAENSKPDEVARFLMREENLQAIERLAAFMDNVVRRSALRGAHEIIDEVIRDMRSLVELGRKMN